MECPRCPEFRGKTLASDRMECPEYKRRPEFRGEALGQNGPRSVLNIRVVLNSGVKHWDRMECPEYKRCPEFRSETSGQNGVS